MTLGIRAHDLGFFNNPADLAKAAKTAGLDAVQLVVYKSFPQLEKIPGALSMDWADDIRRALDEQGLSLALLGAYFHWFDPSVEEGRLLFEDHLAMARRCGTSVVGTEVQGITTDRWGENPENDGDHAFTLLLPTLRRLDAVAAESDAYVGIEGAVSHALSTPEKVRRLRDETRATRVRFIFDLFNFLNHRNHKNQRDLIDRSLAAYGSDLIAVHCKDFKGQSDSLDQVAPGQGDLDYSYLLRRLKEEGLDQVPLILEGVTGDDIPRAVDYLRELSSKIS